MKWLWLCVAALSLAMLAARQVGAQAPASAALAWLKSLYSAECALPSCWQGIRIGETTVRQAAELLGADAALRVEVLRSRSYGTWVVRSYRQIPPYGVEVGVSGLPDAPIASNGLWIHLPAETLRIGDVMAAFGAPEWAWMCRAKGLTYYRIGTIRFLVQARSDGRFSPYAPLVKMDVSHYARRHEPLWQGFTYRAQHAEFERRFCMH
ncbi:MAG: hypothetical protein SNJ58_10460 [Aggregatilineales bacterium]